MKIPPATGVSGRTKPPESTLPLVRNPSGPARIVGDAKSQLEAWERVPSDLSNDETFREKTPGEVRQAFLTDTAYGLVSGSLERKSLVRGRVLKTSNRKTGWMKGKRGNKGKKLIQPSLPPTLQLTPSLSHTFRYNVGSTGTLPVTASNLITAAGCVCTVNLTTAVSQFTSVKVHSVKIWPAVTSTAETCLVTWGSSNTDYAKDDAKNNQLPGGLAVTKPVVSHPPKGSLWRDYITLKDPTVVVFSLTAPTGSVLDLHATWQLVNTFPTSSISVSAATLGNIFYPALDGPASNHVLPVELPTKN